MRIERGAGLVVLALLLAANGLVGARCAKKEPPITIEINSSPWYAGFEAVVERYEKETGNKVNLDVTPYPGMLQKARDSVRGKESPHDLVNLDSGWTIEFF